MSGARQARYRRKFERLDLVVPRGTRARLRGLAAVQGCSQAEALCALFQADAMLSVRARATLEYVAQRSGMTPRAVLDRVLRRLADEDRRANN